MSEKSQHAFCGIPFLGAPSVLLSRIQAFEESLGMQLPKDYFTFLLETNGQELQEKYYIAIPTQQVVRFGTFLGLDQEKNLNIEFWIEELDGALPPYCIAIAFDPGGNLFLLSLEEDSKGTVYYYDRAEVFPESSEEEGNTYEVATTFTDFVRAFRDSRQLAEEDLNESKVPTKPDRERVPFIPKEPTIVAPKGKTLVERLGKLKDEFPSGASGSFGSMKEAMQSGFQLSMSLDDWGERDEKFLNQHIPRYIAEDPDLAETFGNDLQGKLLYNFLWGYVLGQVEASECTDMEFAHAKKTIRQTMNLHR